MEGREIVNTKENVFYSAYLTERQQFNDVDPDVINHELLKDDDKPKEITDIYPENKEGAVAKKEESVENKV